MTDTILTCANMRTRNGLIRVQKGYAYLLPLLHQGPHDVLTRMMKEESGSISMASVFKNDANDLRKKGFVIAHDSEILGSEHLRRQAWGSKLGLDIKRDKKRVFLKPIKNIVAQDTLRRKRPVMISSVASESEIDLRTDKLFKEEMVRIHKMDLLRILSGRAAQHIRERLQRLGSTIESATHDRELLHEIKKKFQVLKKTPIYHAKSTPFPQQIATVQYVDAKELGLFDSGPSSILSLQQSDLDIAGTIDADSDKILSDSYTDTSDYAV